MLSCSMNYLLILSGASWGTLVLGLYLWLVISNAPENATKKINMSIDLLETTNKTEDMTLMLTLSTELEECMVVKAYLKSSVPMDTSFDLTQTACLYDDSPRHLYWQFVINETMTIEDHADAVSELGICPDDEAVVPIVGGYAFIQKNVTEIED